ncbi:hypothetical protein PCANC_21145 [Puccinia coronata f. sp. avenae]|uniref:Uncharacterized protein n=1 Tax=Puccinia coronata f. sp. avenae TaxID=200324 RepID=A0A2N5SNB1_9BASI|nr:hypothetical protein PCANC_21145 [Puccinia coronata f. sp. avenae]
MEGTGFGQEEAQPAGLVRISDTSPFRLVLHVPSQNKEAAKYKNDQMHKVSLVILALLVTATVQLNKLILPAARYHLWGETYDLAPTDVQVIVNAFASQTPLRIEHDPVTETEPIIHNRGGASAKFIWNLPQSSAAITNQSDTTALAWMLYDHATGEVSIGPYMMPGAEQAVEFPQRWVLEHRVVSFYLREVPLRLVPPGTST